MGGPGVSSYEPGFINSNQKARSSRHAARSFFHMHKRAYYIINAITWYRVIAAPVLILLLVFDRIDIFKWLLPISFFTDAIDGYLARKYKVSSIFGSRLDSIGDDLTVLAGLVGLIVLKPGFFIDNLLGLAILAVLFVIQVALAIYRYKKTTSFHTYAAKVAAIAQGCYLILFFLIPDLPRWTIYVPLVITAIDLVEEILLVLLLPNWQANVKGLFWALKKQRESK